MSRQQEKGSGKGTLDTHGDTEGGREGSVGEEGVRRNSLRRTTFVEGLHFAKSRRKSGNWETDDLKAFFY